jgi:hypothetical protein
MLLKDDQKYFDILIEPLRVCMKYKPKLGHGGKDGYSSTEFRTFYGADPFYKWMGLDSPLMYAAHKAAGGMTSVYRQLGIGCERLFRAILQDKLLLTEEQSKWSYKVTLSGGRERILSLDGRIALDNIGSSTIRCRVEQWMTKAASILDIDSKVQKSLDGVVFEVRQGYKSKDSKRQNADIANAATAYTKGYLPCAAILSLQIDEDIALRYTAEKWLLLTGLVNVDDPHKSVYAFMKSVVGYDLAAFFNRNKISFKKQVTRILKSLLEAR